MRERDIHKLIEQQDPEAKQRIWEKVCAQIDFDATQPQQATATKSITKNNLWKWITATVAAVVVVVTLAVVLPLMLKDSGTRFCDYEQYTTETLDQTLGEYFTEHDKNLLFIDLYDDASDVATEYGYNKNNTKDIIYFKETLYNLNSEALEIITLSVTDNKTQVDIFEEYYKCNETFIVKDVTVLWQNLNKKTVLSIFEYQQHTYYVELENGDQARLTEIIEGMLQ